MWWIISFYVIPGMLNTWLVPKFVDYNGGIDSINSLFEENIEISLKELTAWMSFLPIINILSALPLICWYLCIPKF